MSLPRTLTSLGPLLAVLALASACGDDAATPGGDTATASDTASADDVASADAAAEVFVPPLEKVSRITFKLNGVNNDFDVAGGAFYVAGGDDAKLFKVSANKGTRKIEINILPVEPFAVGTWSDSVFSEVGVLICYNDGTGAVELPSCPVGFTHESIAYDVTVTTNNGPDSRVEGTFTATFQDSVGGTLELTEGVFDVLHR